MQDGESSLVQVQKQTIGGIWRAPPFTSYRAELRGLLEALSRAAAPTWVVCDNQAVCEQAAALIAKIEACRAEQPRSDDLELQTPLDRPDCDCMWKAVAQIIERAPRNFYKVSWMPSHLMDSGKETQLEDYLLQGGSMLWAQGDRGADILADMGAQSAAPAATLLWKDHIVKQLARVVQTMQVTIWASFNGHVCSDLELTAAEVSTLVQDTWDADEAQWNDIDFDDPFMSDFLCQEDCEVNLNPDEPDV